MQSLFVAATFIELIGGFLQKYGALSAIILSWIGIGIAYWKKRRAWQQKVFMQQVNFSLNEVLDGTLTLRTLLEESAQNVFLNDFAATNVLRRAARTTVAQPFIEMPTDADMDYVKRAVLNVVSERFAEAFVARSIGVPIKTKNYVFGITCEKYGNIVTQKLRVMLVAEDVLKNYFVPNAPSNAAELKVVVPTHSDRITTLQVMGKLYTSSDPNQRRLLGTLELGIPTP